MAFSEVTVADSLLPSSVLAVVVLSLVVLSVVEEPPPQAARDSIMERASRNATNFFILFSSSLFFCPNSQKLEFRRENKGQINSFFHRAKTLWRYYSIEVKELQVLFAISAYFTKKAGKKPGSFVII
jgi:hypothetical protein